MTNVTPLDPALNEIKFKPPQQDIQQLGTALAIELNMVMEPCTIVELCIFLSA